MNSSTNLRKPGKFVNAPVMKKDAMALVTGKPVYMDDVAPKDCLVVKVLRSPHAHALIKEIRTDPVSYTHLDVYKRQALIPCNHRTGFVKHMRMQPKAVNPKLTWYLQGFRQE